MSSALDIHAASNDEVASAHANVFDIWSKGLPLEEHIRYRLESPSHSRATWYVGCLDGRVVVSLGCYPLVFRIAGHQRPGIAIGSVYTLGEFRGRGFAPQLLKWVEGEARQRNVAMSVLYSDIDPGYYARLGYTLCPSLAGWRDPRQATAPSATSHRLMPILPHDHLSRLMELYATYHGAMPLSIARDAEYWVAMLKKFPDDEFYALQESGGSWAGYVRIGRKGDAWRITDFALADQSSQQAEHLYSALLALAKAGGAARVGGWLPDSAAAKRFFELAPRRTEITMVKPLDWQGRLDDALVAGTSRFCEIDHV